MFKAASASAAATLRAESLSASPALCKADDATDPDANGSASSRDSSRCENLKVFVESACSLCRRSTSIAASMPSPSTVGRDILTVVWDPIPTPGALERPPCPCGYGAMTLNTK